MRKIKSALAGLMLIILSSCSAWPMEWVTNKDGTVTITLSKEEAFACQVENGCITITRLAFDRFSMWRAGYMCGKEV